jgi:hypothetical protein
MSFSLKLSKIILTFLKNVHKFVQNGTIILDNCLNLSKNEEKIGQTDKNY